MNNFRIGSLLSTLGELVIAYTVLRVHHRVLHEKKIDRKVFRDMSLEQVAGILGTGMIAIGFILEAADV